MSFENYEKFLEVIDSDIKKIFDNQKEYIFCKEGCSLCCKEGDYPLSELEFQYLMKGFEALSEDIKTVVNKNIEKVKTGNRESYECPFLIHNVCSVYKNRPLVCRAFGVLTEDANGKPCFPLCTSQGLNFSQIYDEKTKHLSSALVEKGNFKIFPRFFRLSNTVIMNVPMVKNLNITFGKTGKMIDFFEN